MVKSKSDLSKNSKLKRDPEQMKAVAQRYKDALNSFVEKLKQDRYIIAAMVCGSLSYDEVWEKSDIDLIIITSDENKPFQSKILVEHGIMLDAYIYSRNEFKKRLQGSFEGSILHSFFSKSTLLFTKDETIKEYYDYINHVGERDKELQLMQYYTFSYYLLTKAEKNLYIKNDPNLSYYFIARAVTELAKLEVVINGQIPLRDVINQALAINPSFFNAVYTDIIHIKKDEQVLDHLLTVLNQYMDDNLLLVYKPVLEYLANASEVRSESELNQYFGKKGILLPTFYLLAEKGIVLPTTAPVRLTSKSTVQVDEPAYYYDGSVNGGED
ncbi:MAG: hypothetical protein ACFFDI_20020 [Promethearchaeota archaeon]